MIKALENEGIEGEIINIGSKQTHTMKDILALIQRETNVHGKEIVVDEERFRPKDLSVLITDNAKAMRLLKWAPTTSFEEGIRKTIRWYLDNGQRWGYEEHGWRWRY
jgi:nucleoside-diphosphate-sugar epimerase